MKSREPLSSEDETSEPIGKLQAAENSIFASRWERFTPYIAEYWGTLVVTATFLCNVDADHGIDPSFRSICHAFMVVGMVSATKHVTGSSLNPSVSLALALAGRQKIRTAGFLCIAQILGAITAVAMCTKAGIAKDITLGPILGHNWFQVALLETLYATMMCIVYLNCAASTKNNPKGDQNGFVGLAYGLCYLASHNAATGVCKTVTNSAISIALIVWGQSDSVSFGQGVGYFFYDLLGAFLAAGAYRVVRPHEFLSGSSTIEDNILESAPLAAEFTGTFFVVLTQICTKMSKLVEHDMGPQAFGTAAAVISMVYAFRDVSGAHFNPAVTLAVRSSGRTPAEDLVSSRPGTDVGDLRFGVFYTIAQVLAGMLAAAVAGMVHTGGQWAKPIAQDSTAGQVMIAEGFGTFFLCYVVLGSSVTFPVDGARSKQNNLSGLAYGSVELAATLSVGNISGALMNPACAVAAAMVGAISSKTSIVVYCFYHAGAGVLAAASFLLTHAQLYVKDARDADDLNRQI
mmetsp:Transcript_117003/g.164437  ORF Transcript_117003/g.164437 Transcript_117003/m.164437 type:complete len:517 (+) Transcript_117003:64-1614(+)